MKHRVGWFSPFLNILRETEHHNLYRLMGGSCENDKQGKCPPHLPCEPGHTPLLNSLSESNHECVRKPSLKPKDNFLLSFFGSLDSRVMLSSVKDEPMETDPGPTEQCDNSESMDIGTAADPQDDTTGLTPL